MIHHRWAAAPKKEGPMRFNELAQNAENDNYNKWDIDDTRRPKLTLRHLHKLRNMKELAKAEHAGRVDDYKKIYGSAGQSGE